MPPLQLQCMHIEARLTPQRGSRRTPTNRPVLECLEPHTACYNVPYLSYALQTRLPTLPHRVDSNASPAQVRHPYIPLNYAAITKFNDTTFLINARSTMLELIGQMVPVELPPAAAAAAAAADAGANAEGGGGSGGCAGAAGGARGLLFLGSPRCGGLSEMQAQRLFLSDIPLHDMSAAYILLAEQRQVCAPRGGGCACRGQTPGAGPNGGLIFSCPMAHLKMLAYSQCIFYPHHPL
jgi:hypothetical protein